MLSVKNNNIKLTRGDTAYLTVPIVDSITGNEYKVGENETLTLSVRKNANAKEYLMQKQIKGGNVFKILPSDTKNLRYGVYVYDVQLDVGEEDIFTVITASNFEISTEITS